MEYLAFKKIIMGDDGELMSPVTKSRWGHAIIDGTVRPCLMADRPPTEDSHGVYAASLAVCTEYYGDTYLVAPLPPFVLGTKGWRAAGAYIVAGPLSDPAEALQSIISFYLSGYRQVEGILTEAVTECTKRHLIGVETLVLVEESNPKVCAEALYSALTDASRYDPRLVDALLETGNYDYMLRAAVVNDNRFDPRLVEAIIRLGRPRIIANAAIWLSDSRYDPRLVEAIIQSGEARIIADAALWLSDSRFDPRLVEAVICSGNFEQIKRLAVRLPDSRYNPRLVDALLASKDARSIAFAMVEMPDERYDPRLIDALIATEDAYAISEVTGLWQKIIQREVALTRQQTS